ncbi:MAG TPA: discoidin domain-containing protein [Steroidobacteraceae bacterium]|nr:discoidin domain-containing protein [Steroidobacteraceae bacterium]
MSSAINAVSVPLTGWQPTASGEAQLELQSVRAHRPALEMRFDFKGGKGFVVARQAFKLTMPSEYAVSFRLRGRAPVNDLELKLVDESGLNVWRHVYKDLRLPSRWKRFAVDDRQIDFAWGPASGSALARLGFIELAIVAGEGGAGRVWIADLDIHDLSPAHPPTARASSEQPGAEAAGALAGRAWKPQPTDARPWIEIDCTAARTLGGMIIDWQQTAPPSGFRVRVSNSGRRFRTAYRAARAGGARSYLYLPNLRARFVRLDLEHPCAGASLRLEPFAFSRSIDAFWYALAAGETRGWHPRWLHRQQSEWTPIGTSHGTECALMNTDGMVEAREASFSIEPMLLVGHRLITWADVVLRQELESGWMPVPRTVWSDEGWQLVIEAESTVNGILRVRYRFHNRSAQPLAARLFILVRPFQVTPPWQHFRNAGGVSRLRHLVWRDGILRADDTARIAPSSAPTGFAAFAFDEGPIAWYLTAAGLPPRAEVHDEFGFASAAFEFALTVSAGESAERGLECSAPDARRMAHEAPFDWGRELRVRQFEANDWGTQAIRAALTATAHILVTRSGAALQPGPRRYTRSWIRDGAMMSAALLRMGHAGEVAEFIRWYAPHQRADGFVPCCVDRTGTDWLVEHDSHGELIALIADHHRFTADGALLEQSWVFVQRAAECIEKLLEADGLLPISASHEGYLAQPVHSYWDDFWALRGLLDAAELARSTRREGDARRWSMLAGRLARSLFASIEATRARRQLDFIPGSVEWADFDPTATANAIYLLDVPDGLDRRALERTFDKYLADWRAKRAGAAAPNYTPYEIRIIGALVRLGRRQAALELLRFFLSDRRPPPWNQWPEIAWQDRSAPAHVGDLPHTWIAAEYVLALRSLFAYERGSDLILGAGLAPEWIEDAGVAVRELPTPFGPFSYTLRRVDERTVRFTFAGSTPARLILRPPLAAPLRTALVDGRAIASVEPDSLTLTHVPAEVICISE